MPNSAHAPTTTNAVPSACRLPASVRAKPATTHASAATIITSRRGVGDLRFWITAAPYRHAVPELLTAESYFVPGDAALGMTPTS